MGESAQNLEAYLSKMVDLFRIDGVRFPDNKQKKFTRLDPIYATGSSAGIHAEGRWTNLGETDDDPEGEATVGVVFGPQYGPVTAKMIEESSGRQPGATTTGLRRVQFRRRCPGRHRRRPPEDAHPHGAHSPRCKSRHGRPAQRATRQPVVHRLRPAAHRVKGPDGDGMYTVEMEGVDIYDPVNNTIVDTGAAKVAAWFVDGDYDGRTFCITQAFFPGPERVGKAQQGAGRRRRPGALRAFSGTVSLPFPRASTSALPSR